MKPAPQGITLCIRASRGSARSVNVPGAAVMPAASVRISTVFTGSSRHPGLMASPLLATSPTVVRRALASPTSPVRVDLRHAASAETAIVHPGTPLQPAPGHGADHTGVDAGDARRHADSAFFWWTAALTCPVGLSAHRAAERGRSGGRHDRPEPAAGSFTAAAGPDR